MELHTRLKEMNHFLSDYAISLMGVGVQTSRVVRNTARIGSAFGFMVDMTIFQKSMILTVRSSDEQKSYSMVSQLRPMPLNFYMNAKLSALSWQAYDEKLSLEELKSRYNKIMSTPREKDFTVLFLVACANASFCRLFQGDFISMLLVFVATLGGFFLRQQLLHRGWNHFAVFILSAFTASFIASSGYLFDWGHTPEVALGTSVLYLIPGVPLINSIMDLIDGHILAGVSRFINATMLILCIAIGLSTTLFITQISTL